MTNYDLDHEGYDSRYGEMGSGRHLTVVDIVLLICLALGSYFGVHDFVGATPKSEVKIRNAPASSRELFCSDEELRLMRSGPETCYGAPDSGPHDKARDPSHKALNNS